MPRVFIALAITVVFAVLGWAVGGVTLSGAAAGLLVAFSLYYGIGAGAFAVLFLVFAITWIATRVGYARKQRLGIAERRRGRRNAGQVLANVGVSGLLAALALAGYGLWAVIGAMAALAEAAADTAGSECGEAWSDTAYLVTGFLKVPAGTDGAITMAGNLAGLVAAALVAGAASVLQVLPGRAAVIAGIAGILGTLVDSFLGATLERRGWMNNNAVNLSSTLAASVLAVVASRF